jgi:multiple sugar transport system substrate-binding protein
VLIMDKYRALGEVSHPDNLANGTLELNTVYQAGDIAMQIQYHEFAASIEDASKSRAAGGRTAYAACPKGDAGWLVGDGELVNGCNCGIGGIGINASASEDLKRAAYIFSIWATSKDTQFDILKGVVGTPTRKSVLEIPEVAKARTRPTEMPNALTFDAVYDIGIRDPNFVLGPKIPQTNEYHSIILTEVQRCVAGETTAEEACAEIKTQVDDMHDL